MPRQVRICPALLDHKSNDFTLEIVGFFSFAGWPHLVLTTILTTMPTILSGQSQGQVGFFGRNSICCDMRASVGVNALKSWLAIISAVPSNFQAENASLNNWIALCRMDS